jgi:riboflavin kinase/FMN adenylyltransferase
MKIVHTLAALKGIRRTVYLAAGFFDGVHAGHARVIGRTLRAARRAGGEAWVLTFQQHPEKVLVPRQAPPLLSCNPHKARLLSRAGVDGCILLPFNRRLARQQPEAFVRNLKRSIPQLKAVFVGGNWRFGRGGAGTPGQMAEWGRALGFTVRVVAPVRKGAGAVSSTRIRAALRTGRLREAESMLGHPFSVLGTVVHGRRIGRQLGYPTANLEPNNEVLPPPGVYAVLARVGTRVLPGVVNLGVRPTFATEGERGPLVFELHVLDFTGNLYGQAIEVLFVRRLRGERRYRSASALAARVSADVREARRSLSGRRTKKIKDWLYTPGADQYIAPPKHRRKRGRRDTE